MAVGAGSLEGYGSYLAVGRESTFGTGVTTTSQLEFISASMKVLKETKIIEQVETSRTYSKQIKMGKMIEGEFETYAFTEPNSFQYLMFNGFGGTVTSTILETAGAYQHSIDIGNMDGSYPSLSMNMRKGQETGGKVFEYSGVRVNEMMFTAEIDEALKATFGVIAKDATQTTNDVSAALATSTCNEPLSFVNGRISVVAGSLAGVTTTSFWHVQSVEFGVANNLKADEGSRRIGSDTLDVLPPGIANLTLNLNIRFDTVTAYQGMIDNTDYAVELEFLGSTITGTTTRRGMKFQFPVTKISDAGDPDIGGPDEQITSSVVFQPFRDCTSAGGYAMRCLLTNDVASY